MTINRNKENRTLSLGNPSPQCLSETEPEAFNSIMWAINMAPNPTIESSYKICGGADELSDLNPAEVKAAIGKALEEKKAARK